MMTAIKPLPSYLVKRYHGWKATTYRETASWYRRLAEEGQTPRAMVISCCDSRVSATSLFGADPGEFFIHRNIANLVHPYTSDGGDHAAAAAVEFAVGVLKVSHIIVLGHSGCGGAAGCHDMCAGKAPHLEDKNSFVGRWLDALRPAYPRVKDIENDATRYEAFEKEGILISLDNLMGFPFIEEAVQGGHLSLHGLWKNIGDGAIEQYIDGKGFEPI